MYVSAVKRSEDNTGLIVRIYETAGKATNFNINGDILPQPICDTITPWSVETYYLKDGETAWQKVLFTEYEN